MRAKQTTKEEERMVKAASSTYLIRGYCSTKWLVYCCTSNCQALSSVHMQSFVAGISSQFSGGKKSQVPQSFWNDNAWAHSCLWSHSPSTLEFLLPLIILQSHHRRQLLLHCLGMGNLNLRYPLSREACWIYKVSSLWDLGNMWPLPGCRMKPLHPTSLHRITEVKELPWVPARSIFLRFSLSH